MRSFFTDRGSRTFLLIWAGQLVSQLGSGLTGFALGVWIYEGSGSVTQFAAMMLSIMLPGVLITPVAGMLSDRWDRRRTVIACEVGRAFSTFAIAVLLYTHTFALWSLCLTLAISSIFNAFKEIAATAMVATLIPKAQFGRATGLLQMGRPATRVLSPMLAAVLLGMIGIEGVVLVDFATFAVPILALFFVDVPKPEASAEGEAGKGSTWREISSGWVFIKERPGVLALLLYFTVLDLTMGLAHALYRPMLLSFTSVEVVGTISSIGASGVLLGSVVLTVWGGPKRRVESILVYGVFYGLGLILLGLRPSPLLVGTALFGLIFGLPISRGCIRMIWMRKTPADLQGRVFAVWTVIAKSTLLLAYVAAGPLADHLFEPLLAADGPLSGTVGLVIGVGAGRGIGFLYVVLGVLALVVTGIASLYPKLRRLEHDLPDAIGDLTSPRADAGLPPPQVATPR
jgi:MFS family permease